jgi:hypothetical protein
MLLTKMEGADVATGSLADSPVPCADAGEESLSKHGS